MEYVISGFYKDPYSPIASLGVRVTGFWEQGSGGRGCRDSP